MRCCRFVASVVSLIAFFILVGTAGVALAADLAGGGYKDTFRAPIDRSTWSGFYFGGHLGGNFGDYDISGRPGSFDNGGSTTNYGLNTSRVMAGGQIGFDLQLDWFVLGIEGMYSRHSATDTRHVVAANVGGARDDLVRFKFRDTASVAARFGFANGKWLPYFKIGAAWADVAGLAGDTDASPPVLDPSDATRFSGWEVGWLVGAGLEYKFDPNWSIKGEYQYMDLGSFRTTNLDGDRFTHDLASHSILVGLNYRF